MTMMTENGLTKYLLSIATQNGIRVRGFHGEPNEKGYALLHNRKAFVNLDMSDPAEFGFVLGHEIGHVLNGDSCQPQNYGKVVASEERRADLFSLQSTFDYAAKQFDYFEEPYQLMEQYGIPYRMIDDTCYFFRQSKDFLF